MARRTISVCRDNKDEYNKYARQLYKTQKYPKYLRKIEKVLENYHFKNENSYEWVAKQFRKMAYRLN